MAVRKPLVSVGGVVTQLPEGDSLPPQEPEAHTHAMADVSGLPEALASKQPLLGFKITVSQTEPLDPEVGDVWISY